MLILGLLGSNAGWSESVGPKHFRPAPLFELKDQAGQTQRLQDFRGSPVVVHFWASWCAPCVEELPQFLALAKSSAEAVAGSATAPRFLAISLDKTWKDAHKVLPEQGLPKNFVSLLDPEAKAADQFGSYQFPESYLLNSALQIVEKWIGPQDWESASLRAKIR